MHRLLLLLAILIISLPSYAQKIRFGDEHNKWTFIHEEWENGRPGFKMLRFSTKHYFSGDTIINGLLYLRLACYKASNNTTTYSYVRENNDGSLIYINFVSYGSFTITSPKDWKVGDKIGSGSAIIKAIDSILINNVYHKRAITNDYAPNGTISHDPTYYIEGLGIVSHRRTMRAEGFALTCFYNKTGRPNIPALPGNNQNNCSDTALSVETINNNSNRVTVYPQPAKDQITILFPSVIQNGAFVLTDKHGRIILTNNFKNKDKIELRLEIPQGIYFYRITDDTAVTFYTGKVVIND
ncbi:MAG: T9SS type A sorting domain-containing protein [Sphingobacteriales bacterium]|nr:MAG: T9SS type A sorting domain-containing protein [Sphingobacteriales bacterium]